jgi:predicted nuclease of predicted toxin-antitoxin system
VTARLYLDEDLSPLAAEMLRSRGYDVVSAHDVAAVNLTDEEQLIRAVADGRAIVSYNFHDFKSLAESWYVQGRRHAAIVLSYRQYGKRSRRDSGDGCRVASR